MGPVRYRGENGRKEHLVKWNIPDPTKKRNYYMVNKVYSNR
jgi:hypothetical protein